MFNDAVSRPRADVTKQRILDAASRLFARQGLGSTSVRDIAKAADVNVALVSHHFGGKQKLYEACVEAMYAEVDGLRAELVATLATNEPLERTVERAVRQGFFYAREHRGAVRLVMRHVLDTGELPTERRETLMLPFLDAMAHELARRTPRSPDAIRLVLQSVLFLISRYALTSVDELALVSGCPGEPESFVLEKVARALGSQALWLLGLPFSPPPL